MTSKKTIEKERLKKKQIAENKKFNRTMLISFGLLFIGTMSVLIFYTYGCETKFSFRKIAFYKKEIPVDLTCMNGDNLQIHNSTKVIYNDKTYYFCSQKCFNHLAVHFDEVALTTDAYSGDTINKTNAVIGLKRRGKAELVYFKNSTNFKSYYESKKQKQIHVSNK
jgi:hypothetical protein